MTLVVAYREFADAVRRFGEGTGNCVCYKKAGDSVLLTFVNPSNGVQVVSFYVGREDDVKQELEGHGFCSMRGTWVTEASLEHLAQIAGDSYIAAVAYETRHGPGLWMDAFPTPPTEGAVLRAVFEEFASEGLIDEGDFERFIHEARPQVRILEPEDIGRFLKQKPKPKPQA